MLVHVGLSTTAFRYISNQVLPTADPAKYLEVGFEGGVVYLTWELVFTRGAATRHSNSAKSSNEAAMQQQWSSSAKSSNAAAAALRAAAHQQRISDA